MIKLGLTGSIGAGKSTAAAWLRAQGFPVHDADQTVHALYQDLKIITAIGKLCPQAVRHAKIDRIQLGQAITDQPELKTALEALIHPQVQAHRTAWTASQQAQGAKLVVYDIPLLFESGREQECDVTLLITAPQQLRWQRVQARGLSETEFNARDLSQWPEMRKAGLADHCVANTDSPAQLEQQLQQVLITLLG